jgi:hypothetical protein
MVLITNREHMKTHLKWRAEILRAQRDRIERTGVVQGIQVSRLSAHIDGIEEAIACIDAWEKFDIDSSFTEAELVQAQQ